MKNKKSLLALLLFFSIPLFGQKGIDGMINAEKSFAAFAVNNSMKDAFLEYMDSAAIMFTGGKAINGFELWNKREKRPGILNWRPDYAEISSTGDFGFTSGPWTFQPKSLSDTPVASGHFCTTWHLDKNGNWKFLVDFGIDHPLQSLDVEPKKIRSTKSFYPNRSLIEKAETDLNKKLSAGKYHSYFAFLSGKSRFNLNKFLPALTKKSQKKLIDSIPPGYQFISEGIQISGHYDLAFSYGSMRKDDKVFTYMRFWRRENNGWKIALEVLGFD